MSGIIQGASYTDVHARMPAALALAAAAAVGAVLSLVRAAGRVPWALAAAAVLYVVVLVGGGLYSSFVQRFIVGPNEQAREAPYIVHNIAATRQGFALDRIEERELTGDAELTRADIEKNRDTVDNVRLWDHQPLLETFGQIQEIRTYYDFMSVDNDRYDINGRMRQVMLSARELNPAALPNRNWINERLVFTPGHGLTLGPANQVTWSGRQLNPAALANRNWIKERLVSPHGHGLTPGPVNQVTAEGLPVLFTRALPPVSTINMQLTQPSIYFGELSNEYVIGRTR